MSSTYRRRQIKARNPWLARPMSNRGEIIAGVMLHSTRSGVADGDDGPRTEGWWSNPNNIVQDTPPWGSYADLLLFEDGTQVVATDWDTEYASWTAGYGGAGTWAAGHYYIQIEIAQGRTDEAFKEEQIDSLAQFVAEMAKRYNFPIVRIPYLSQEGVPPRGICTHEASANGRKTGKSDPGPMFPWDIFLAKAQGYLSGQLEEDELSAEDVARLDRLEKIIGGHGIDPGADGQPTLMGEDAMEAMEARGVSLLLAIQNLNAAVKAHIDTIEDPAGWLQTRLRQIESGHRAHTDNHAAGVTGPVEEHGHAGLSKDGGRVMR